MRLPLRIHWIARPSGPVSEVDFLIDGRLAWVEHNAPYYYGDDGNWLVTSFLEPGPHTFRVNVVGAEGQTSSDSVTATVAKPPMPPAALAGTWFRVVTSADLKKATSTQPPPTGRWTVRIGAIGWQMHDPSGGGGLFDVRYLRGSALQMRPTIEVPPFPNPNNGGFCEDTDPLWRWSDAVGAGGRTLTLRPDGRDPCGDRAAILEGTWTRVSP